MKYINVEEGIFLDRPNRFIANVLINGNLEKVYVKNTGRCKELLVSGEKVYLERSNNYNRKTKYTIISVYKGTNLINIDSIAPNHVAFEGLSNNSIIEICGITNLEREKTYNNSRFDIYYETKKDKGFIEVKGVTLEKDGIVMFPDAPTKRGTKHVYNMIDAIRSGYKGHILFIIQMDKVQYFTPNTLTDIEFCNALKKGLEKGLNIIAYNCKVSRDEIILHKKVKIVT